VLETLTNLVYNFLYPGGLSLRRGAKHCLWSTICAKLFHLNFPLIRWISHLCKAMCAAASLCLDAKPFDKTVDLQCLVRYSLELILVMVVSCVQLHLVLNVLIVGLLSRKIFFAKLKSCRYKR